MNPLPQVVAALRPQIQHPYRIAFGGLLSESELSAFSADAMQLISRAQAAGEVQSVASTADSEEDANEVAGDPIALCITFIGTEENCYLYVGVPMSNKGSKSLAHYFLGDSVFELGQLTEASRQKMGVRKTWEPIKPVCEHVMPRSVGAWQSDFLLPLITQLNHLTLAKKLAQSAETNLGAQVLLLAKTCQASAEEGTLRKRRVKSIYEVSKRLSIFVPAVMPEEAGEAVSSLRKTLLKLHAISTVLHELVMKIMPPSSDSIYINAMAPIAEALNGFSEQLDQMSAEFDLETFSQTLKTYQNDTISPLWSSVLKEMNACFQLEKQLAFGGALHKLRRQLLNALNQKISAVANTLTDTQQTEEAPLLEWLQTLSSKLMSLTFSKPKTAATSLRNERLLSLEEPLDSLDIDLSSSLEESIKQVVHEMRSLVDLINANQHNTYQSRLERLGTALKSLFDTSFPERKTPVFKNRLFAQSEKPSNAPLLLEWFTRLWQLQDAYATHFGFSPDSQPNPNMPELHDQVKQLCLGTREDSQAKRETLQALLYDSEKAFLSSESAPFNIQGAEQLAGIVKPVERVLPTPPGAGRGRRSVNGGGGRPLPTPPSAARSKKASSPQTKKVL